MEEGKKRNYVNMRHSHLLLLIFCPWVFKPWMNLTTLFSHRYVFKSSFTILFLMLKYITVTVEKQVWNFCPLMKEKN